MPMKTYPMKVEDGKVYAVVTLRDVVERCDVSDLPMLAEVKRLYDENAKLRTFIDGLMFCHASSAYDDCIGCPLLDQSTHNYRCTKTECMRDLGIEVTQ